VSWIDAELVLVSLAAMFSPTTLSFSVLALVPSFNFCGFFLYIAAAPAFLVKLPVAQVQTRNPGARIVASEHVGSTNRLWVQAGAVQDALANAGLLEGSG